MKKKEKEKKSDYHQIKPKKSEKFNTYKARGIMQKILRN